MAAPALPTRMHRHPLMRREGLQLSGPRAYRERGQPSTASFELMFRKTCPPERFAAYVPCATLDTHDPATVQHKLAFLRKRSKIVEIVGAQELVFGLTLSGVCAVFDRTTRQRLGFVNISPDEAIRSLFYNEANDSLITVSVYRLDNFSSLKCRTTPLEYIRQGRTDGGVCLFESECLKWPGFVEFDHVNGKVLTYSAADKVYKLWSMANYDLHYAVQEPDTQELKIAPGVLLLIFARRAAAVPLKVLAIEDGRTLLEIAHPLLPDVPIELIELFGPKLLVKQQGEPLQILDIRTGEHRRVASEAFLAPSAFIYLYEHELFVTFRQAQVHVWDLTGQLVTRFEDHTLWHADCSMNNVFISSGQQLLLSYCRQTAPAHGVSAATAVAADAGGAAGVGGSCGVGAGSSGVDVAASCSGGGSQRNETGAQGGDGGSRAAESAAQPSDTLCGVKRRERSGEEEGPMLQPQQPGTSLLPPCMEQQPSQPWQQEGCTEQTAQQQAGKREAEMAGMPATPAADDVDRNAAGASSAGVAATPEGACAAGASAPGTSAVAIQSSSGGGACAAASSAPGTSAVAIQSSSGGGACAAASSAPGTSAVAMQSSPGGGACTAASSAPGTSAVAMQSSPGGGACAAASSAPGADGAKGGGVSADGSVNASDDLSARLLAAGASVSKGPCGGSINISSIATGKSVARISSSGGELQDVTALWYNEEANEIYVGNKHGAIQIWANG